MSNKESISTLEQLYPRVAFGVVSVWHSPVAEVFLESLIVREKEIERQGFDLEAANELLFLYNIHTLIYGSLKPVSHWDKKDFSSPMSSYDTKVRFK